MRNVTTSAAGPLFVSAIIATAAKVLVELINAIKGKLSQ